MVRSRQQGRITLHEYSKPGWTVHAKGLWYHLPNEPLPAMTMVGSPNFGKWTSTVCYIFSQPLYSEQHLKLVWDATPPSHPLPPSPPLPYPSFTRLPLEVGPHCDWRVSPSGSAWSPAAKRILAHFRHKFVPFWLPSDEWMHVTRLQALLSLTEQVFLRLYQLVRRDTRKRFLGSESERANIHNCNKVEIMLYLLMIRHAVNHLETFTNF